MEDAVTTCSRRLSSVYYVVEKLLTVFLDFF